ncbi:MAG: ABC transporter ATP-binding protein [Acidobacteria bacterium]|nr:ABC transporter ATP-binding protein [Acidobacteriota bacterium]
MGHELRLTELAYEFPGFDFGPVSLRLKPGRIYGVLGANGAGKSTLLNLVAQQLRPASGRIAYGGQAIGWDDPGWKARYSYVRETPAFYDDLRVREVLAFTGNMYERWDAELAARLAQRLQLDAGKRVGDLSKGNLVKLGLVAGIGSRTELLILDEPTAGLDPSVRAGIQGTLRELMAEQADELTILLSSHIFEDLEEVADDILILRDGNIVFEAARRELDRMVLYRCSSPEDLELTGARLTWRAGNTRWVLTWRAGDLAEALAVRPGCVEERPKSLLEAVYHGAQLS